MAFADFYDHLQRLVTLDRRVQTLEEQVQMILSRQESMSGALIRLDGRIDTVKAEILAELYRHLASTPPRPEPSSQGRPALPPGRRPRRSR